MICGYVRRKKGEWREGPVVALATGVAWTKRIGLSSENAQGRRRAGERARGGSERGMQMQASSYRWRHWRGIVGLTSLLYPKGYE